MDLQVFVSHVQSQLTAAAALGDDRTRETAESLAAAAEPALRLALMCAVSSAADEITAALLDTDGSPVISCLLDGDQVRVDVRLAPSPSGLGEGATEEGEPSARISLRLRDMLKNSIEAAARAEGVSVNTWLVRAAAAGLRSGPRPAIETNRSSGNAHRVTGWING